ncbi:MAG: hypothetical protein HQL51_11130 [Magnetococcales bacterium]|nr:hypothetical protein [Magnetococcales bacterium]
MHSSSRKHRLMRTLAALLLAGALSGGAIVGAADFPWKDEVYTKTVFEEDVKVLLAEILKRNGQDVIFRPGVAGVVNMEFSKMPLQAAFNKLMEENGLAATFDAATNSVTISQAKASIGGVEVFSPEYADIVEIEKVMAKYGALDQEVHRVHDATTNTYLLKGPQDKVQMMLGLMKKIDNAFKVKAMAELNKGDMKNKLDNNQYEMKIFQLNYASVDTTKGKFQGQDVTIPGVIDTLKSFVGNIAVRDDKKGALPKDEALQSDANRTVVSVDRRTNSVIVQGTRAQIEKIGAVLAELDKPVPLIEIEVLIVNGADNITRQLGVQWGAAGGLGNALNGTVANVTTSSLAGNNVTYPILPAVGDSAVSLASTSKLGTSSAGFIYHGSRSMLDVTLSALATNGVTQTIAAPRIVTLNNMEAKITDAQTDSVPVTTLNNGTVGLQAISSGLNLNITPSVMRQDQNISSRMVRMDINAKKDASSAGTIAGAIKVAGQEIKTNVIIPENATFVMGGLFSTERGETENGVPGLKDVPLLGYLFKYRESIDKRVETVFFLTPKVYDPSTIADTFGGGKIRNYMNKQRNITEQEYGKLRDKSELIDLKRVAEDE